MINFFNAFFKEAVYYSYTINSDAHPPVNFEHFTRVPKAFCSFTPHKEILLVKRQLSKKLFMFLKKHPTKGYLKVDIIVYNPDNTKEYSLHQKNLKNNTLTLIAK